MNLTISGSIIIDLNDDVNYSVVEYAPVVAERRMDGTYGSVDETIRVNIRGTTVSGVTANIKKLLTLAHDAQRYDRTLDDPVSLHYNGYRTTITRFDVQVPTTFFNYPTMLGVLDTNVSITRKGLFISNTKRDTWTQTTSGISNQVVTVTGLSTQPVYAPTDVRISGVWGGYDADSIFPTAYIICADRASSSQPAIARVVASGFYSAAVVETLITDSGRLNSSQVVSLDYAFVKREVADGLANHFIGNIGTKNPHVISLVNAYPKTHVFGLLRNTSAYDWESQISILGLPPETTTTARSYYTACDNVFVIASGEVNPKVAYFGTITRNPAQHVYGLGISFFANAATTVATTPGSTLLIGDVFFVGDDTGTNITRSEAGRFNVPLSTAADKIVEVGVENNYLSGYPSVSILKYGYSINGIPFGSATKMPVSVLGATNITTKSSVIDLAYLIARDGAWVECMYGTPITPTASGALYLRIGIDRPYATNLVGIE